MHTSSVMQEQRFTGCLHVSSNTGDKDRQEVEISRGAQAVLGTSVDAVDCP